MTTNLHLDQHHFTWAYAIRRDEKVSRFGLRITSSRVCSSPYTWLGEAYTVGLLLGGCSEAAHKEAQRLMGRIVGGNDSAAEKARHKLEDISLVTER